MNSDQFLPDHNDSSEETEETDQILSEISEDDDSFFENDDEFYTSPTVEYDQPDSSSAIVLAFIAPGTGACINGHYSLGIGTNMAAAIVFFLVPYIAVQTGLFPVPVFGILFILLFAIWIPSIIRAAHTPCSRISMLTPWKHIGIGLLSFWIPFASCFFLSTNVILQRTWMGNETMAPGMKTGDIVLVDKTAFWHSAPDYGDLVLVEDVYDEGNHMRQRAFFARIIARPGDSIQLFGLHPSVNGERLPQYIEKDSDNIFKDDAVSYEVPFGTGKADLPDEPEAWYPIRASRKLLFSATNLATLDDEFYYVLEDNRDMCGERGNSGYGSIIHQSEIKGRPQYVIYNTVADSHFARYGTALR